MLSAKMKAEIRASNEWVQKRQRGVKGAEEAEEAKGWKGVRKVWERCGGLEEFVTSCRKPFFWKEGLACNE